MNDAEKWAAAIARVERWLHCANRDPCSYPNKTACDVALQLLKCMRDASCRPAAVLLDGAYGRINLNYKRASVRETWIIHGDGEVSEVVTTHGMSVAQAMTRLRCRKAGVGSP